MPCARFLKKLAQNGASLHRFKKSQRACQKREKWHFLGVFRLFTPETLVKNEFYRKIESKTRHHLHASLRICDVLLTWGEAFLIFRKKRKNGKKAVCRRILAVLAPDRLGRSCGLRPKRGFLSRSLEFLGFWRQNGKKRGLILPLGFFGPGKMTKNGHFWSRNYQWF